MVILIVDLPVFAFTSARLPRFLPFLWPTGHKKVKNWGKRARRVLCKACRESQKTLFAWPIKFLLINWLALRVVRLSKKTAQKTLPARQNVPYKP